MCAFGFFFQLQMNNEMKNIGVWDNGDGDIRMEMCCVCCVDGTSSIFQANVYRRIGKKKMRRLISFGGCNLIPFTVGSAEWIFARAFNSILISQSQPYTDPALEQVNNMA